jgi:hypothetical protein
VTPLSTYYAWPLPKPGGLQRVQIQFDEFPTVAALERMAEYLRTMTDIVREKEDAERAALVKRAEALGVPLERLIEDAESPDER